MSGPSDEERDCIAAGLLILDAGAVVADPGDAGYRLSKGIAIAELPVEALFNEQPLDALEPTGRRFLGVSDEAIAIFDLAYDEVAGPSLLLAASGIIAERTLDACEVVAECEADDLVIVRMRGMPAEGLWVRGGGAGVITIVAPNGAVEGESFIGACRRIYRAESNEVRRGNS